MKRTTLMAKLLSSFGLILLLLLVVAGSGFFALYQTGQSARAVGRAYQAQVLSQTIGYAQTQADHALAAFLLTGDELHRESFAQARDRVDQALAALAPLVQNPDDQVLVQAVQAQNKAYFASALAAFDSGTLSQSEALLTFRKQASFRTNLDALVAKLVERQEAAVRGYEAASQQVQKWARAGIALVTLGALAAGTLLAFWLSRGISRPVVQVGEVAGRLATGDLTVPALKVSGQDEIGAMAGHVTRAVSGLRDLVQAVQGSVHELSAAAQQMAAVAGRSVSLARSAGETTQRMATATADQAQQGAVVKRTADELQATIEQIAQGAANTARDVEQASQSVAAFEVAVQTAADRANQVSTAAAEAAATAQAGARAVERTISTIGEIRGTAQGVATELASLGEAVGQIGVITSAIAEMAEQTNLLALNAATEAARAGEAGRGFAVVAEEVRKLAERSAASTRNIDSLVQAIRERTERATAAMAAGSRSVEQGTSAAAEAGAALQSILRGVQEAQKAAEGIAQATRVLRENVGELVGTIQTVSATTEENTAAAEEMAAGALEVLAAVGKITTAAQEAAAAAEECAATVADLADSAGQVSTAAGQVADIAQRLETGVQRFRL